MSVYIVKEVRNCMECDYAKNNRSITFDSFEHATDIFCMNLNKQVHSYIEHNREAAIPDNCPLRTNYFLFDDKVKQDKNDIDDIYSLGVKKYRVKYGNREWEGMAADEEDAIRNWEYVHLRRQIHMFDGGFEVTLVNEI